MNFGSSLPKKDSQPGKSSPLRFRKGYFCYLALEKVTKQFQMSKWFGWKCLEGKVQLAISEMKILFPKIFGHFNFQLRYPNKSLF